MLKRKKSELRRLDSQVGWSYAIRLGEELFDKEGIIIGTILTIAIWASVLGFWIWRREYFWIAVGGAFALSISLIILISILERAPGSVTKIDKATGKKRCRICHNYFLPYQLTNDTCPKCYHALNS